MRKFETESSYYHFLKAAWLLSFLMIGTWAYGQITQKVQVVEYMGTSPKRPLAGVTIAAHNAPQAQSDARGDLQLHFRTLKEGDPVEVRRVEKPGYELFNADALQQWNLTDNKPFRIVMCRTESLKQMREQYMQAASASYRQQYILEREKLDAEKERTHMAEEEYDNRMGRLQEFYNQQFANLATYVEQFTRIDLSELSQQQADLVRLVSAGKFDEAIAAYEKADYVRQLTQQVQDIQKIDAAQSQLGNALEQQQTERHKILQAIYRQVTTYQMAGGSTNYRKAYTLLHQTTEADTTDFESAWLYARFAHNQHMWQEVQKYALRCIRLQSNQPLANGKAYAMIADSYAFIGDEVNQEKYLTLALEALDRAQQKGLNAQVIAEDRSALVLIKAELVQKRHQPMEALRLLNSIEKTLVDIHTEYPTEKSRFNLANLLIAKSYVLKDLHANDKELRALSDSLIRMIRPYSLESDEMMNVYSEILNARIYIMPEHSPERETCARESNRFMEKLYQLNPRNNDINYFVSTINLVEIYVEDKKYDEATAILDKAKEMEQELDKRYQGAYPEFRMQCLYQEMLICLAKGDKAKAHTLAQQGLASFKLMAPELKKTYDLCRRTFESV